MDGDIVPLQEMLALAEKYDAMIYIDDAHGTGVLGERGSGVTEYFNLYSDRIIHMGTLSKAYGAIGGFVSASQTIIDLLRLTSSAYAFTSTIPPDQVAAISKAIDVIREEPELLANL
jgi:glycine C-acetyltransferase